MSIYFIHIYNAILCDQSSIFRIEILEKKEERKRKKKKRELMEALQYYDKFTY